MNISDSESRVMEALWREHPLSSTELVERVAPAEGWSPKTVRTLLDRLVRKEAVERERVGRTYRYRPLLARDTWIRAKAGELVDHHLDGRLAPLVAAFAEAECLSESDREDILRLLEKMQ